MAKKIRTSFALSETALDLIKAMAEKQGVSQAAVLEMVVRKEAAALNIQAAKS